MARRSMHIPSTGVGVSGASGSNYAGQFSGEPTLWAPDDMSEQPTPAAPRRSRAHIRSGQRRSKTELCVRFPTGAVQVIATEP